MLSFNFIHSSLVSYSFCIIHQFIMILFLKSTNILWHRVKRVKLVNFNQSDVVHFAYDRFLLVFFLFLTLLNPNRSYFDYFIISNSFHYQQIYRPVRNLSVISYAQRVSSSPKTFQFPIRFLPGLIKRSNSTYSSISIKFPSKYAVSYCYSRNFPTNYTIFSKFWVSFNFSISKKNLFF